jgi:NO-binding membrane sensor protein with MHYT domain
MYYLLWGDTGNGWFFFQSVLTVLGAAAAVASGRALASTWGPIWLLLPYVAVLSAAVRFLHFALFQDELLSFYYYVVTLVLLLVIACLSYMSMRATQMATQYSWAYQKAGLNWRPR